MPNEISEATALSTKASKALDLMRARIVKGDDARTETAHKARAAAEAWDALATHAAKQADECQHGADQAERTLRRWAR